MTISEDYQYKSVHEISLVSVVIIFLNAEKFIKEAIESVLAQTYLHWELLLVDDGSTDASTEIARKYASQKPNQIRYFEHPGHQNRGMSASRNEGINRSRGIYIAFLDADDVWLSNKLERQVDLLESIPEAAMLYGNTRYWYSWTDDPDDRKRDYIPELGVEPDTLVKPPDLLSRYLRGTAIIPCTCSLLVRRKALDRVGTFEESFHGMYEDQVFYAKIVLSEPVYVSGECLELYRQHSNSNTAFALINGSEQIARQNYLVWLEGYLVKKGITDRSIWANLRKQLWLNCHYGNPEHTLLATQRDEAVRWIKKWLLRLEERFLPTAKRRWS